MADQEYQEGTMDITEQEKTFARFVRISTRAVMVIVGLLILLYIVNG
ncbi:aa3 type cytochrome c oxidase subunit IV [Hasllibacter halocynthiae]|uniref:Aa3 type cytochrome c oxidase subunit IV n=1 Tax=Hasllibacter halocynthiae TaxID=595589 RepID=A0A2T0X3Y9_9RHOB|nr:aa3-type cytochrome c oxidase subunit IV [Hasllibacter halocynthiae]PRY93615.1 aa3 type cytochrome c oxidase subunit IV [Hasllibacter halocynthiae]